MSARRTPRTDSDESNRNTGCGASAHQTHEMANDSATNYSVHDKYNYQHNQPPVHEDPVYHRQNQHNHHHHQRQDSDDSLSVRSIQVSQSSVKPLQEPSL